MTFINFADLVTSYIVFISIKNNGKPQFTTSSFAPRLPFSISSRKKRCFPKPFATLSNATQYEMLS